MFSFLKPLNVPRTQVARDNPIVYEKGQAELYFYNTATEYIGKQVIPIENKWSDGTPSFMAPLAHYHLLQTETFHVTSGSGIWFLKGKTVQLTAGDDIVIPRCTWHTFKNLPGSKEPLAFEYRYDSQRFIMEERFFRNTLTYLWDCKKANVEPSVLQLCVFLSACWMPAGVIPCPGDYLSCAVNALFMWILSFLGQVLYGYKSTYPEYWDEDWTRTRIAETAKKNS